MTVIILLSQMQKVIYPEILKQLIILKIAKLTEKCGEIQEEIGFLDPIPIWPNGSYSDLYNPDGSISMVTIYWKIFIMISDKWHIREESELELNKLLSFLKKTQVQL